jgi:nicotinamide mononucleotide transporter
MILTDIFQTIYQNFLASSWIEALAVFTGLLSVWYAKKENILVYPVGIVSVLIYVYLCFTVKLYAEMGINAYYFLMSVYGWVKWSRKTDSKPARPITKSSRKEWMYAIAGFLVSFFILYYVLDNYTDSTVPFWDALTTAIFIIGMWQMALKKIDNWISWIIGDAIAIPLYTSKGLALTSVQYIVFLALAVAGYMAWKKKLTE